MFRFFFRITNKSVGGFSFFFIPFYFFPFFLFFYFYFQRSRPPKLAPQFFIRSDLIVTPSWLSLRRFDSLDGLSIHQFFFPFFFFFQSSSLRDVSLIHSSVSNVSFFFYYYYFSDVRWTISGQSSLIFVKKKKKRYTVRRIFTLSADFT